MDKVELDQYVDAILMDQCLRRQHDYVWNRMQVAAQCANVLSHAGRGDLLKWVVYKVRGEYSDTRQGGKG